MSFPRYKDHGRMAGLDFPDLRMGFGKKASGYIENSDYGIFFLIDTDHY